MKSLQVYLNFNGKCREAMTFYKECLGGELNLMTFADAPEKPEFPIQDKSWIMHGTLIAKNVTIMACDNPMGKVEPTCAVNLSIDCESKEELTKIFTALSKGGSISMPVQDTFWGAVFGMCVDQYGFHWMTNFDKPKS